jgi:AAA15 family ATPase/GTPase
MNNHFIKNIEIKNFKCFKDFKAEGFGRVNLIGGKNNVGKTAFLEACYLVNNLYLSDGTVFVNRDTLYFDIIKLFLSIEQNRKGSDFLVDWLLDTYNLNDFDNFEIELPNKVKLSANSNMITPERFQQHAYWNDGTFKLSEHRQNPYFYLIRENNKVPNLDKYRFVSPYNNTYATTKKLLSKIKELNKNDYINEKLKILFNILKIDLTDNDIILFDNNNSEPKNLSQYGDGIKHFINVILTLLVHQNTTIFLDEIENGIHYTNLDKLWEIILTISKEQNVQVFATTHSKECIESYARVAKHLEKTDIKFLSLYRDRENELKSITLDYETIQDRIELGLDNR